jgi:hypothetical protein
MITDNVLTFPKQKIVRDTVNDKFEDEEVQKAKEKSVQNYVDSIVDDLAECILCELDNNGIDRSNEDVIQDINMSCLILKSAVYRSMNKHYVLHDFLDDVYKNIKIEYIKPNDEEKT